jgi:hypothetical protein
MRAASRGSTPRAQTWRGSPGFEWKLDQSVKPEELDRLGEWMAEALCQALLNEATGISISPSRCRASKGSRA